MNSIKPLLQTLPLEYFDILGIMEHLEASQDYQPTIVVAPASYR